MRIAWATDIHLNFLDAAAIAAFGERVRDLQPDLFVVSGDIAEAPSVCPLLRQLAEHAKLPAHFVLGNHDFYDGEVAIVRQMVQALEPNVGIWLPAAQPISLGANTVMIGADGWGDARLGNPMGTRLRLNDFLMIYDLRSTSWAELVWKLRARGDAEAQTAREAFARIPAETKHVLFVTHVPPFRSACWHDGVASNDEWLPFFTCKAMGDLLLEIAQTRPALQITVLCGHTHSDGEVRICDNLHVRTGGAEYGAPTAEVLEL